jgi:hypothetical protein
MKKRRLFYDWFVVYLTNSPVANLFNKWLSYLS